MSSIFALSSVTHAQVDFSSIEQKGGREMGKLCFLCLTPCDLTCDSCGLIDYCGKEHLAFHRVRDADGEMKCLPYKADTK